MSLPVDGDRWHALAMDPTSVTRLDPESRATVVTRCRAILAAAEGEPPRAGRPAIVRGNVVGEIVVSTPLDPLLSLRALSSYAGLSVRKLRGVLGDPRNPLPYYHVGGKILVRRSEFDTWVARYRRRGRVGDDLGRLVDEIVRDVRRPLARQFPAPPQTHRPARRGRGSTKPTKHAE